MRSAYLEISKECNLNCVFCSLGDKKTGKGNLASIKETIKNYAQNDFTKIIITGGEPFLNSNLEEIIKFVNSNGFRDISIQTNGTVMTEEQIKFMSEQKNVQIIFSIHSHIPKVEDSLMNGKDVLKKQLKNLVLANKYNMSTPVTIVINSENVTHLPELVNFFITQYPFVKHFSLNFVDPVGNVKVNSYLVPKYSQSETFLLKALFKLKKAKKTFRLERVPLCYMLEFAEYSTEMRRIITKEHNFSNRKKGDTVSFDDEYFNKYYVKAKACEVCFLRKICPGINIRYAKIHGTDELYPIFTHAKKIILKSGAD